VSVVTNLVTSFNRKKKSLRETRCGLAAKPSSRLNFAHHTAIRPDIQVPGDAGPANGNPV